VRRGFEMWGTLLEEKEWGAGEGKGGAAVLSHLTVLPEQEKKWGPGLTSSRKEGK